MQKRLPNPIDILQAELSILVQNHPHDEKALQFVRDTLKRIDEIPAAMKEQSQ